MKNMVYVFGVRRPQDKVPWFLAFENHEQASGYPHRCTTVHAVELEAHQKQCAKLPDGEHCSCYSKGLKCCSCGAQRTAQETSATPGAIPPGEASGILPAEASRPSELPTTSETIAMLRDPSCSFNSGYRFLAANAIERLTRELMDMEAKALAATWLLPADVVVSTLRELREKAHRLLGAPEPCQDLHRCEHCDGGLSETLEGICEHMKASGQHPGNAQSARVPALQEDDADMSVVNNTPLSPGLKELIRILVKAGMRPKLPPAPEPGKNRRP